MRDFHIRRFIGPEVPLPAAFNFAEIMPPVQDQGQDGSCVAFASGYLKDVQEELESPGHALLSRECIYLEGLKLENRLDDPEGGLYVRDAFKILQNFGTCLSSEWPYQAGNRDLAPETKIATSASTHKIKSYASMTTIQEIKQAIMTSGSVAWKGVHPNVAELGLPVYSNWMAPAVDRTGLIPEPAGDSIGGHALAFCGWADGFLIFENSWMLEDGRPWAPDSPIRPGFGRISETSVQAALDDGDGDAWTSVDILAPGPPVPPIPPVPSSPGSVRIQEKKSKTWKTLYQWSP